MVPTSTSTSARHLPAKDCAHTAGDSAKRSPVSDAGVADRDPGEAAASDRGAGQPDGFTMSGFG